MILSDDAITSIKKMISDVDEKSTTDRRSFYFKMMRLKSDLIKFQQDIEYVLGGGTIIYASDSTEIKAFVDPNRNIKDYLYDIEESLSPHEEKQKIIKRWYRLRELFYNQYNKTIVLPSHMQELERDITYYSQVLIDEDYKLGKIIDEYQKLNKEGDRYDNMRGMIKGITEKTNISESERRWMSEFMNKYSIGVAAMTYNKKYDYVEHALILDRLMGFIKKSNITDLLAYNWGKYFKDDQESLKKISNYKIANYYDRVVQVSGLLEFIRGRRLLSNVQDAQALISADAVNKILEESGRSVRLHLVTSTLAVYILSDIVPEGYLYSNIRHPKFLPGLMHYRYEQTIKILRGEFGYIIEAIEAFIIKYKNVEVDRHEELIKNLKRQISKAWQKIESTVFLREMYEKESREINKILSGKRDDKYEEYRKAVDFMVFMRNNDKAFNIFVHDSYRQIFYDLINFYLMRMIPLNKYKAVYLDSGGNDRCYRMFLQSEGIRSVVEFNDKKLIDQLKRDRESYIEFGVAAKDVIEGKVELQSEYEVNLIKALFLATEDRWHLVCVMCNYAIKVFENDKNVKNKIYEAYYLLSITQRLLALERIDEDSAGAMRYFKSAKINLEKAKQNKTEKDYRFIMADSALGIELLYYSDRFDASEYVSRLMSLLSEIQKCGGIDYYDYLEFRCYQILISIYFAWYVKAVDNNKVFYVENDIVVGWYQSLMRYDIKKRQYKNFAKSVRVIAVALPLMFDLDNISKPKAEKLFDALYRSCGEMRDRGFYRRLVHDMKVKIVKNMKNRFYINDDYIQDKWYEVWRDMHNAK
jgi:hypothetical protein